VAALKGQGNLFGRPQTDTNWTVQAKTASALERQGDEPVSGSDSSDTPVEYPDDPSPIKAMRKAKKKVLFHFLL